MGQEIETPCQNVCVVDSDSGCCIGCGRTRAEIAGWLSMTASERQEIMEVLDGRLQTLTSRRKRKGGARARRSSPDTQN